jgi:hypothetical protein
MDFFFNCLTVAEPPRPNLLSMFAAARLSLPREATYQKCQYTEGCHKMFTFNKQNNANANNADLLKTKLSVVHISLSNDKTKPNLLRTKMKSEGSF